MSKLEISLGSMCVGLLLRSFFEIAVPSPINTARVILREENKPSVIRIYKLGTDQILVENSVKTNEYFAFNDYLKTIGNKYDRAIEKATIEKLAFEK